jgi:hypothetical protein
VPRPTVGSREELALKLKIFIANFVVYTSNQRTKQRRNCGAASGPGEEVNRRKPPYSRIDPGIRKTVKILFENGVETIESCEGGAGHPFNEATVRFCGGTGAGFHALSVALENGLRVSELRRCYVIQDGVPVGPHWEMIFLPGTHRTV